MVRENSMRPSSCAKPPKGFVRASLCKSAVSDAAFPRLGAGVRVSSGILCFQKRRHVETKIWKGAVLTVPGVPLILGPFYWQSKELCIHIDNANSTLKARLLTSQAVQAGVMLFPGPTLSLNCVFCEFKL